ncbi:antibiotic biosynthesis monooxygenase [Actinocorallia aurea]
MSGIGRIMTMQARPGRGEELANLLLKVAEGLQGFPGCELYAITREDADADTVRVIEVWRDAQAPEAALSAPSTGGPSPADVLALLAGPPERVDLTVLGGAGLS